MKQPSIEASFGISQPYQRQSRKWKELTDAVTHFIVKDELPVYTAQKDGFRKMLKKFDTRYDLPTQCYFSRTAIPELYTATKERVTQQLNQIFYFSCTTDLWSSIGMKPYMSFTICFIDENWKMQSLLLSTQFLPEDHTAAVIADALQGNLDEWSLRESNLVCLTTDSGANIKAAARKLNWTQISCFGHNLHLAITKAVKQDSRCARVIGIAHKFVSSFSMSWKSTDKSEPASTLPSHGMF